MRFSAPAILLMKKIKCFICNGVDVNQLATPNDYSDILAMIVALFANTAVVVPTYGRTQVP